MRKFLIVMTAALASACAYPKGVVSQGAADSGVYVVGAPADAELIIDGLVRGAAQDFDGKRQILKVTPGRHVVVLRQNGQTIFQKDIFVSPAAQVPIKVN